MAKHIHFSTTLKEIVSYAKSNINEEDIASDINDLHKRCWHCGEIEKLCRCHIIPASRGGIDHPSNYVLLCRKCHELAPNCTNKQIMFDWLKSTNANLTGAYLANDIISLYQQIYQKNLIEEFDKREKINSDLIKELFFRQIDNICTHLGDSIINVATWVGIYKMCFDEFDEHSIK